MRILRHGLIAGLGLALLVAGCGVPQGTSLSSSRSTLLRSTSDSQLDALVASTSKAWAGLNTASGQVTFWEKKGSEVSSSTAEFFWSRPEKLRANVLDSSSSSKKGVKLVYLGDGKITAKLGFFKKTFAYDDPQVCSLRGYRIDQTSLSAMIASIVEANAPLTYVGASPDGKADVIERPGSAKLLPDLAKVQITVDRASHMPTLVQGFAPEGVVFKATVSGMALNPVLPSDIFNL